MSELGPKGSIDFWEALALRLTLFPGAVLEDTGNWWKAVAGEHPEKRDIRPRDNARMEHGGFKDGTLVLGATPERIDWFYRASETDSPGFGAMGPFSKAVETFRCMQEWLKTQDRASRIAFGAVLVHPVPSFEVASSVLTKFVPGIRINADTARDFTIKVNRPHNSRTINTLRINRLATWSVIAVETFSVSLRPGGSRGQVTRDQERYACKLDLDISTQVDYEEGFQGDQLAELMLELSESGEGIARNGDPQ